jgi:hypothetical protein
VKSGNRNDYTSPLMPETTSRQVAGAGSYSCGIEYICIIPLSGCTGEANAAGKIGFLSLKLPFHFHHSQSVGHRRWLRIRFYHRGKTITCRTEESLTNYYLSVKRCKDSLQTGKYGETKRSLGRFKKQSLDTMLTES